MKNSGIVLLFLFFSASIASADSFSYPNFSSSSGLVLTGAATTTNSILRLTPDQTYQAGAAWTAQQHQVADGFTTSFTFRLDHSSPNFADGIWFGVQNASSSGAGAESNSVWVEFDTFQNIWDPNNNHMAVISCGTAQPAVTLGDHDNGCTRGLNANLPSVLSDGNIHASTVTYSAGIISVSLDGQLVLNVPFNMNQQLNLNEGNAWVGFSTTTGAYSENNDLLSWSFASNDTVPEPTSIALLGAGLTGLLARRRSRLF